ncbi:SMK killer toxin resistance protein [Neophaeococcomyces mojaviensis]|uniref:SMK killer toxin resistance protein n=1 Tax=Neophaeococcomyces mojaviensis TaxID=3383035 RepID=A0ACC3AHB1_9EURO|nr:SMK killer toxin resistance protein [Knufia sp. JES_112]
MATFFEELWNSIFTPGTTPTLLVATNVSFAALQFLLLVLLFATYSIHFLILSILSAGLWYAINWFARELQIENAKAAGKEQKAKRDKSPEPGSDTETETAAQAPPCKPVVGSEVTGALLQPDLAKPGDDLRRRRSLGDSSGYVSTDSEWEKVSEGGSKK